MSDYTCTLTADGWQLYSDMKGATAVAADLSGTLTVKVREAKAKLKAEPMLSEQKLAESVRDAMYDVMERVSKWGAIDTEPCCVLVAELEDAFGLDQYSLDR
jgi:hypothetical protein